MTRSELMLEVCVQSDKELIIAQSAGAQRIELCSKLEVGGLTPSIEMVQRCMDLALVPIVVLVRSRGGDFFFDQNEQRETLLQAREIARLGVKGIVSGGLTRHGQIDENFVAELRSVCTSVELVFHRAFDEIMDKECAVDQLVTLGVDRILTSGGVGDASQYLSSLANLRRQTSGRIELLPAGGIRSSTAARLLKETGCSQLHASFRLSDSGVNPGPDSQEIKRTRSIMDSLVQG
jgi:copper homeostasis protein